MKMANGNGKSLGNYEKIFASGVAEILSRVPKIIMIKYDISHCWLFVICELHPVTYEYTTILIM